ncbi:family 1 glycosylhydrolase [Microbispora rosea]|uniref:family 1 glycosylhydrolase n=1 Tax=Microbispora rosea TaxID=58117 RepID=UPI003428DF67
MRVRPPRGGGARRDLRRCDLTGYLVWSLLHDFEWAYGFRPRFGIVSICRLRDPATRSQGQRAVVSRRHRTQRAGECPTHAARRGGASWAHAR